MRDVRSVVAIRVDGEEVNTPSREDLLITNPEEQRPQATGWMMYWGSVLSALRAEAIRVDSAYRNWRAEQTKLLLSQDPKMSEWKAKAMIESLPDFLLIKDQIAEVEDLIGKAKAAHDGYAQQAVMLGQTISKEVAQMRLSGEVSRESISAAEDPRAKSMAAKIKSKRAGKGD